MLFFTAWGAFTGSIDNVSVKEVTGQEVVPDSGCGSWLLEPQSTNLVQQSNNVLDYGQNTADVTLSTNLSPEGVKNCWRCSEEVRLRRHLEGMTVHSLKAACRSNQLRTGGRKADLIDRIVSFVLYTRISVDRTAIFQQTVNNDPSQGPLEERLKSDLNGMTLLGLRIKCGKLGLLASGSKAALVQRIFEHEQISLASEVEQIHRFDDVLDSSGTDMMKDSSICGIEGKYGSELQKSTVPILKDLLLKQGIRPSECNKLRKQELIDKIVSIACADVRQEMARLREFDARLGLDRAQDVEEQ